MRHRLEFVPERRSFHAEQQDRIDFRHEQSLTAADEPGEQAHTFHFAGRLQFNGPSPILWVESVYVSAYCKNPKPAQ